MSVLRSGLRLLALGVALSCVVVEGCSDARKPVARTAPVGPAPDSFRVTFETTRGTFVVEVKRALAPHGADRFYDLVAEGFFDDNSFFRVVPNFVAQFGVNNEPKVNESWDKRTIPDDPVKQTNAKGTLVFASSGANSRAHQLFVNLADNKTLDGQGFAPIGQVVEGMPVVASIYSGYGEQPSYHLLATLGNSYLKRMFPKVDYIKTARLVTTR
jgi:peptidyl-prolyl cis-trans isomerase A (cyclophilin A)